MLNNKDILSKARACASVVGSESKQRKVPTSTLEWGIFSCNHEIGERTSQRKKEGYFKFITKLPHFGPNRNVIEYVCMIIFNNGKRLHICFCFSINKMSICDEFSM